MVLILICTRPAIWQLRSRGRFGQTPRYSRTATGTLAFPPEMRGGSFVCNSTDETRARLTSANSQSSILNTVEITFITGHNRSLMRQAVAANPYIMVFNQCSPPLQFGFNMTE